MKAVEKVTKTKKTARINKFNIIDNSEKVSTNFKPIENTGKSIINFY
jgi:hypothetical protein